MTSLSLPQRQVIESPLDAKLFFSGPAGTGKTSVGVERMRFLLAAGVPADTILMLTPQRTLQEPYLDLLYSSERTAGGEVTSATIPGEEGELFQVPLAVLDCAEDEKLGRFLSVDGTNGSHTDYLYERGTVVTTAGKVVRVDRS